MDAGRGQPRAGAVAQYRGAAPHQGSQELVSAFKQAYRLLWFSGIPRPDALLQLEAEYGHLPEIAEFITFVRSSERGILPAEERKRD